MRSALAALVLATLFVAACGTDTVEISVAGGAGAQDDEPGLGESFVVPNPTPATDPPPSPPPSPTPASISVDDGFFIDEDAEMQYCGALTAFYEHEGSLERIDEEDAATVRAELERLEELARAAAGVAPREMREAAEHLQDRYEQLNETLIDWQWDIGAYWVSLSTTESSDQDEFTAAARAVVGYARDICAIDNRGDPIPTPTPRPAPLAPEARRAQTRDELITWGLTPDEADCVMAHLDATLAADDAPELSGVDDLNTLFFGNCVPPETLDDILAAIMIGEAPGASAEGN